MSFEKKQLVSCGILEDPSSQVAEKETLALAIAAIDESPPATIGTSHKTSNSSENNSLDDVVSNQSKEQSMYVF